MAAPGQLDDAGDVSRSAAPRDTRGRLVAAGAELLSEGGYGAASVQAIAARAGLSTGALYRHFPSKAHLFVEVFRTTARRDLAAMSRVPTEGGLIDRLVVAVELHARRALADRRLAWALVHEPVDELVDAERLAYRRRYTRMVAGLLRRAIAAGEIPPQDVELSAAAITGGMAEALVGPLSPVSGGDRSADEIVAHLSRFCRRAVGAAEPRATRPGRRGSERSAPRGPSRRR